MRRFDRFAAGAGLFALVLFTPAVCPGQPPHPAEETPPGETPAEPPPAGLLPFPGGKVTIGMPRKGNRKSMSFQELVEWSVLGRMSGVEASVVHELSPAVGEHEVVLPSFWISKYEVTNAQYHEFLKDAGRVEVVIPPKGKAGARTLEEISRLFLRAPMFKDRVGKKFYPTTVDWEGLYDLNEDTINPKRSDGEKRADPKAFRDLPLPPGVKITAYRFSVPGTWTVRAKFDDGSERKKLQDSPLPGTGDHPVTGVALTDAIAFSEYYGLHVPTEIEWEACARGPKGEPWPTGEWEPLGMAWSGFNNELANAQTEAVNALAKADKRVEKGESDPLSPEKRARYEWIAAAKPIEEPTTLAVPVFPVGLFPLGAAPCGALDMLGNAEEWVSTPLTPWPGTDSRSNWLQALAYMSRGGNAMDKDIFLTATIRKFIDHNNPRPRYARYGTLGFRVARYKAYGASAASHAVAEALEADPPILPGEIDPKSRNPVFTGLDLYRAMGIEKLDEVAWDPAGSPANDPTGKVFWLGPARSLCVVPADGVPCKDISALRRAADRPVHDPESPKADPRRPRDILFLGLLHMSDGMEVKGEVYTETLREVPLKPGQMKRAQQEYEAALQAWEARKKAREEAKAAEEEAKKEGDGAGGDGGGGEDPPPDERNEMRGGGKKAGGGKGDPPPEDGGTPEHEPDAPAEDDPFEEEEVEDPRPVLVSTRRVAIPSYEPGFVKGDDHPGGLLLGVVRWGEEKRAVLWPPRMGKIGTTAPGGSVLLEAPLIILPVECLEFKKANREGTAFSNFDTELGEVEIGFFIPSEGGKAWFEFRLKLLLGDYPPGSPASPWRATVLRK